MPRRSAVRASPRGAARASGARTKTAPPEAKRRKGVPPKDGFLLQPHEIRFGEQELVAVYGGEGWPERGFLLARLTRDVLVGDDDEDAVVVDWFEEESPTAAEFYEAETKDNVTPVGSLICAVGAWASGTADGGVRLRDGVAEFVSERLRRQLEDGYEPANDAELGDASFERRAAKFSRAEGRARAVKRERGGDDDAESDGGAESDDSEAAGKGRGKKKKRRKAGSEGKITRSKGSKLVPQPNLKGLPSAMDGKSPKFDLFDGDMQRACKELIRAVRTGNMKLLKAALSGKAERFTIFSINIPLSVDVREHAMLTAIRAGNKEAVQLLREAAKRPKATPPPTVSLKRAGTGKHTSRYANYARRAIKASRGSKEGNSALLRDVNEYSGRYETLDIDRLRSSGGVNQLGFFEPFDFDVVKAAVCEPGEVPNMYSLCVTTWYTRLDFVLQAGWTQYAHRLMSLDQLGAENLGLNAFHVEALGAEAVTGEHSPFSKPLRAASVIKKSQTDYRFTPVHCAAINDNLVFLKALLAGSPDASRVEDTRRAGLLHYAASSTTAIALKHLLASVPSLSRMAGDKNSWLPIHVAAMCGSAKAVEALLAEDADLQLKARTVYGYTAVHLAAFSRRTGAITALRAMAAAGADLDQPASPPRNKVPPLLVAASMGNLPVLEVLLELGANPCVTDAPKRTALVVAALNGHAHVVSYLTKLGIDPDSADSSGNSAVMYAAAYGWDDCLQVLLEAGASPSTPNHWSLTPLAVAVRKQRPRIALRLSEHESVDVNFVDAEGKTQLRQMLEMFVEKIAALEPTVADVPDSKLLLCMPVALKLLLARKDAKVGQPDAVLGETELHVIASAKPASLLAARTLVALAKLILERAGAGVELALHRNEDGQQAVLSALESGNMEAYDMLSELSPVADIRDGQGASVAQYILRQPEKTLPADRMLGLLKRIQKSAGARAYGEMLSAVSHDGRSAFLESVDLFAQGRIGIDVLEAVILAVPEKARLARREAWYDRVPSVDLADKLSEVMSKDGVDWSSARLLLTNMAGITSLTSPLVRPLLTNLKRALNLPEDLFKDELVMADPSSGRSVLATLLSKASPSLLPVAHLKRVLSALGESTCSALGAMRDDMGTSVWDIAVLRVCTAPPTPESADKKRDDIEKSEEKSADGTMECSDSDDCNGDGSAAREEDEAGNEGMEIEKSPDLLGARRDYVQGVLQALLDFKVCIVGERTRGTSWSPFNLCGSASEERRETKQSRVASARKLTQECLDVMLVKILLEGCSGSDLASKLRSHVVLSYQVAHAKTTCMSLAHMLLKLNVPVSIVLLLHHQFCLDLGEDDFEGRSVLHVAVETGSAEAVSELCRLEDHKLWERAIVAPPGSETCGGELPIHLAASKFAVEMLKPLITKAVLSNRIDATDGDGRTALHRAVIEAVEREDDLIERPEILLLDAGARVAAVDALGRNCLHYCFLGTAGRESLFNFPHDIHASMGQRSMDPIEIVNVLVNANGRASSATLTKADCHGRQPLHYSCARGAAVSSLVLMKRGASLAVADCDGNSPLAVCLLGHRWTLAIMLLKAAQPSGEELVHQHAVTDVKRGKNSKTKVVVETSRSRQSCFWHGVKGGMASQGLVYILLEDFPNMMAMEDAIQCASFQLVHKLVSTCVPTVLTAVQEGDGSSILHKLASAPVRNPDWLLTIARVIMRRGAPPVSSGDRTALHVAAAMGHTELCEYFASEDVAMPAPGQPLVVSYLQARVDQPVDSDHIHRLAALSNQKEANLSGCFEATLFDTPPSLEPSLLEIGSKHADPVAEAKPVKVGRTASVTPFHWALSDERADLAQLFVSLGAELDTLDSDGLAPLHRVVLLDNAVAARTFLRLGADVNVTTSCSFKATPLHIAVAKRCSDATVDVLLSAGADLSAEDAQGSTALHLAAATNNVSMGRKILAASRHRVVCAPLPKVGSGANVAVPGGVLVRLSGDTHWTRAERSKDSDVLLVDGLKVAKSNKLLLPCHVEDSVAQLEFDTSVALHRRLRKISPHLSETETSKLLTEYAGSEELILKSLGVDDALTSSIEPGAIVLVAEGAAGGSERGGFKSYRKVLEDCGCDEAAIEAVLEGCESGSLHIDSPHLYRSLNSLGISWRSRRSVETALRKLSSEDCTAIASKDVPQARWAQAVVSKVCRNGRYVVRLLQGDELPNVPRSLLRPCPCSLEIPFKSFGKDRSTRLVNTVRFSDGLTPLDVVVHPLPFGSFESTEFAQLLLDAGCTVAARTVAKCRVGSPLRELLSIHCKATVIVEKASEVMRESDEDSRWVADMKTAEADSRAAKLAREAEAMAAMDRRTGPPVLSSCEADSKKLVVSAEDGTEDGFYDVVMTKVDVRSWPHAKNVFYKMQIVEDQIAQIFILVTNWGVIGEWRGKHQNTPFSSKEEAVAEFCKVFRSKTANIFSERRTNFVAKPRKYKLVRLFHASDQASKPLPSLKQASAASPQPSGLHTAVQSAVCDAFADAAHLVASARSIGLHGEFPLGKLRLEDILQAEVELDKVAVALEELEIVKGSSSQNVTDLLAKYDDVAEATSAFYSILPTSQEDQRQRFLLPFSSTSDRDYIAARSRVRQLRDLTVACDLVLAATHESERHGASRVRRNPIDYVLAGCGAALDVVPRDGTEHRAIETYFENTANRANLHISNVFSVSGAAHKGRIESECGNKRMLWHGTEAGNVLGILKNGLKIAPSDALSQAGQAYGAGIYSSDMFAKALNYCRQDLDSEDARAYVLLLEVALGNVHSATDYSSQETAHHGFHSTLARGQERPDPAGDVVVNEVGEGRFPLGAVVRDKSASQMWEGLPALASKQVEDVRCSPSTSFPASITVDTSKSSSGEKTGAAPVLQKVILGHGPSSKTAKLVTRVATTDSDMGSREIAEKDGDDDKMSGDCQEKELRRRPVSHRAGSHSEYIVYDESQVCVRYIVEVCLRRGPKHDSLESNSHLDSHK